MKKTLMYVLCLSVCAFAKEGDADTLAGMILGLIGAFMLLYGAICVIYGIAEFITFVQTLITKAWTKLKKPKNVQYVDISKINKIPNADKLLFEVAQWAISVNGLSTLAVQRHFSIGYSRAGKIIDQLYQLRVIGPSHSATCKPRDVIMSIEQILQMERCGKFS